MNISENMIPIVNDYVRSRQEEFGLLIFTNRTPILTFNQDSTMIWEQIDGQNTIREICDILQAKSISNKGDIQNVIIEFLKTCEELGLIKFEN
jgi:hypothetical protein